MDNFIFLEPLTPSSSQPPRLPGGTFSNISRPSFASLSDYQTTSQFNQRKDFLKSQPTKSRNVSDVSQKSHSSDQRCRNDTVQDQDLTTQTSPNSDDDDDDDLPSIEELLSGKWRKNSLASADPNGVDDGFVDIDDVLSGIQQKSMLASANLNSGGIAVLVDNGSRGGTPADSSCSTAGSSRDPIILSDDESVSAESETDYSNLEVDLTAKSDSSTPHIAESDMVDGEGFGFGTTYISDRLVADHQDDSNDSDSGVADGARLQLAADLPRSASPCHGSVTHQASPIRVNTEITPGSASYDDLDVTKDAEEEGIDVLVDDEDDADTYSTKRSGSSASSSDNPASDSNVSLSERQDGQHDFTQSPQPCPAAASHHQSDLTNDLLPRHRRRRDDTKNVRRKRLRMPSLTRPPSTASPDSAAVESNDFEYSQSVALLVAPAKEREIRDVDHEMVDDGGTDDSDEDYDDMSDAAASEIRRPPRSRKRVKRAKDMEHNDVETPSTHSLNVSYQATAATSSVSMQESEEIPIHGYLTLKTIESKVVYCLRFSQELLQEPGGTSQR
ncbi:hypothetical protein DL98DRAFT_598588 [Cadophora sp. DSE1049]|nr:hypothetical protein DL98DRAFT_598588 [Cadophora sp. DSE1049]